MKESLSGDRYPKGEKGVFAAGTREFIEGEGGGDAQPFAQPNRAAGAEIEDIVVDRGQGMLYQLNTIQGDPVADDKMIFYPEGVAEYLVLVPSGDISLRGTVKDVLEIARLVENAVADDEGCVFLVHHIIARTKTALDKMIDVQGQAGIVIQEAPIIEVTYGLVQVEVGCRCKIVICDGALLIAIDPAAVEIECVSFFYGAERNGIAENIRMNSIGIIDIARAAVGIVITDGIRIMRRIAGIDLTCREHGNEKYQN